MNQKQKEKIADLTLDVVKYIITAIVLTTLFTDFANWLWYWYVVVSLLIGTTVMVAVSVYKDENKKKRN